MAYHEIMTSPDFDGAFSSLAPATLGDLVRLELLKRGKGRTSRGVQSDGLGALRRKARAAGSTEAGIDFWFGGVGG